MGGKKEKTRNCFLHPSGVGLNDCCGQKPAHFRSLLLRTLTGLLAADAEVEETSAAVERGDVGDIDFLKVGHHGSEASLDAATAAALAPEVSVASAGEGNSYGHPDPACVEVLEGAGSVFLCTIWAGDVTVEPGAQGPVVSCQKGGEP